MKTARKRATEEAKHPGLILRSLERRGYKYHSFKIFTDQRLARSLVLPGVVKCKGNGDLDVSDSSIRV